MPAPEPDLLGDVRRALLDDHPLELLALVSSLLTAVDPRQQNPFAAARGATSGPSRAELLGTFIDVDRPETSALLGVVAALSADDVERRRLERVLAARSDHLPAWVHGLRGAEAYRTLQMTHLLGDGDNVIVGLRLPTGEELTAIVYIDHNMGTLVKDAFVVPEPIDELVAFMQTRIDDPDTTITDLHPADARTRITDAIEVGAITFPPVETDTWPASRPLVEWMVSLLPEGGRGYERPDWDESARQALVERFFASPFGASLDDREHRELLESILWFGCDYGPGDPLRWSPTAVEILLVDWIPRKLVADAAFLAKAPDLMRAFIRFSHAERGIPARLTDETLDAVNRWEPDYLATIRSPRPQGAMALLAAAGVVDPDRAFDFDTILRGYLERAVGGAEALEALDDAPLPDESFSWDGIAEDIRDRVGEVLGLIDGCCEELLDTEHRTACRRVLRRVATGGPEVFRRRGRSDTAAAAICWAVCRANETFDQRRGGLTQKRLLAQFGLQGGSVSGRARTLLDAGGFPRYPGDFSLGSPDYLVSGHRRTLITRRDRIAGRSADPLR